MDFYLNGREYHGEIAMVDKGTEMQFNWKLGNGLQFTSSINDDGIWEADNKEVDPDLVSAAGNYIENIEDFQDVLTYLG